MIFKGDEIDFIDDESPPTGVHFESQLEFMQWHLNLSEIERSVTKLTLIADFCRVSIDMADTLRASSTSGHEWRFRIAFLLLQAGHIPTWRSFRG